MKKLLTLICLMFLIGIAVQAQYVGNGTTGAQATASVNCWVVTPLGSNLLQSTVTTDFTMYPVVGGYDRTFPTATDIKFPIYGEANKPITITTHAPTVSPTTSDVSLLGSGWPAARALPTAIGANGEADVYFNVTGVHAGTQSTTHGTYTFTLSIDVVYTTI
jgi:hypothetical protein